LHRFSWAREKKREKKVVAVVVVLNPIHPPVSIIIAQTTTNFGHKAISGFHCHRTAGTVKFKFRIPLYALIITFHVAVVFLFLSS
jgi:hypothetical protein